MSEILLEAEHVSKKYSRSLKSSLWYGAKDIASSLLPHSRRSSPNGAHATLTLPELRKDEFWALQDVSFQVNRGECLGLIGHNGAGKSTLLKILNSLIRPDTGRVTIRGRVGALIELNAAFNPILSGRENVYNEAALLGFTNEEVRARFDDIVDFSGVHEFLDMPVQNYSSGMRVRLGFAIAAQLEPDILLIDEVLAVGDVGFRTKCLARMGELRNKCAFVFVSHSMPQVARIATSVLHLDHSKQLLLTDNLPEGLASYYSTFDSGDAVVSGTAEAKIRSVKARVNGSGPFELQSVGLAYGDTVEFEIDCELLVEGKDATIQLVIWNQELVPVIDVLGPGLRRFPIHPDQDRRFVVRVSLANMMLNSGRFTVSVIVLSPDGLSTLCELDRAFELEVASNMGSACSVTMVGDWSATPVAG